MELDHVLVLCDPGAPEAGALIALGLREGSRNDHPGQGTSNRRFFFANAYLELAYVRDAAEAQTEPARAIGLFDRWAGRQTGACPFGLVFRPSGSDAGPPFPTWSYRPSYVPEGLAIEVARDTPLSEPALFFLPFARGRGAAPGEPVDHRLPLRTLVDVGIGLPVEPGPASNSAVSGAPVRFFAAPRAVMSLGFSTAPAGEADLRPGLPLVLRF